MTANIKEGSKELLLQTAQALNDKGVSDYVVIGGWCPLLRNKSSISHPGTLDVDLLFQSGHLRGSLATAIDALRCQGFMASAKHPFQLLLSKSVAGEKLIYNVDLLHPQMSEDSKGMFVDHLELDVPLDENEKKLKKMCSIVQPNSRVLFDENMYSDYSLDGVSFPLVDFTGMFITKIDSCQKPKRERDSLDILIAFDSEDIDFHKLMCLANKNKRIEKSLRIFQEFIDGRGMIFDENVSQFIKYAGSPSQRIQSELKSKL